MFPHGPTLDFSKRGGWYLVVADSMRNAPKCGNLRFGSQLKTVTTEILAMHKVDITMKPKCLPLSLP